MKINQKNNIFLTFLLCFICFGCNAQKKFKHDPDFVKYLENINIDVEKLNDSNYTDYYVEFIRFERKKNLHANKFLKVDKVYMYNRSEDSFTFTVFGSNGTIHIATVHLGEYLELNDKTVTLKKRVPLRCIGDFELKNDIIKVSRSEKTPFKEWTENDVGYIKNDTVVYTETYIAKKYEYKKKWLATTHKTNFRFGYQPTLIANFYEYGHIGEYEVSGSFPVQ